VLHSTFCPQDQPATLRGRRENRKENNNYYENCCIQYKILRQEIPGSRQPAHGHDLFFYEPRLTCDTVALANGFPAVCVFVNDLVDADVLGALSKGGTRLIATRSAGFNHIDLAAAGEKGIAVVRVPSYSPYSVAEHTLGLILTLNRKFHRAYARVREGNFSLDGLLGFDLHGKTVGVVGTGQIGQVVIRILHGFGCRVLAYDLYPNPDLEG
jgi:D-lactate dehydrogenase